ncbi:MAG: histidine phosphatase family protein [Candidatus Pacearchaeota archaeon]
MEPNIYLFRHAEKDKAEECLSERGIKQAEKSKERFLSLNVNKFYSSDLERCKRTAEIVNRSKGSKINYESRLREVEGSVKNFPSEDEKEINNIKEFFNEICQEKGNILICSSGIVNRILIAMFLEIEIRKSHFLQNPTGLTIIDKNPDNENFRISCVNDTAHLPEEIKIRQKE